MRTTSVIFSHNFNAVKYIIMKRHIIFSRISVVVLMGFALLFSQEALLAQESVIRGSVIDRMNARPVEFANVSNGLIRIIYAGSPGTRDQRTDR